MVSSDPIRHSDLRLLILAPSDPHEGLGDEPGNPNHPSTASPLFSNFLTALTKTEPSGDVETFAGYTTHPPLIVRTKYYEAKTTIWCDIVPLPSVEGDSTSEWLTNMQSEEAAEVREVIGGIVILLPYNYSFNDTKSYCKLLAEVNTVREAIEDDTGRDLATVVVIQDMTPRVAAERNTNSTTGLADFTQKLEDAYVSEYGIFGWDIVPWQPNEEDNTITNEYGEKVGMPRVIEVLEQIDWSAHVSTSNEPGHELTSLDDLFNDVDEDDLNPKARPIRANDDIVASQSQDFQRELMGLHFALEGQSKKEGGEAESGDELEVDQMLGLMSRAVEIRQEGAELPKDEREKFARREVAKLMREMKLG